MKVYIVPPDDSFISELGLPASVKSLKGSLLGLQARSCHSDPSLQQEFMTNDLPMLC